MNQTKICNKCNIKKSISEFGKRASTKDGLYSNCKKCKSATDKNYRKENKELVASRKKAYAEKNKDLISEKQRAYREANKELLCQKDREKYAKNREIIRKKAKELYIINRDTILKKQKEYTQLNKEKIAKTKRKHYLKNKDLIAARAKSYSKTESGKIAILVSSQNRRARVRSANGKIEASQIKELMSKQKGKCVYCKVKLLESSRGSYHIDHIYPLSKGGTNDIANIQLLCPPCNLSKHDKFPEEFAENFGMLI